MSSPNLLNAWSKVARRIRAAKHVALFLDFDGTLVPIQSRPEDVRLSARCRRLLARLAHQARLTVWVVSGRRLADVRRRVKVRGLRYAGLHGWERRKARASGVPNQTLLRRARELLARRVARFPGVWVEDKGISFAVHSRAAAPSRARRVALIVRDSLKAFDPSLRVLHGKKVWEVLPREVEGKGRAVRDCLAELPPGTLPIYVGDDISDEAAFAALQDAVTVRVRPFRRTLARYSLDSPEEVLKFLEKIGGDIR